MKRGVEQQDHSPVISVSKIISNEEDLNGIDLTDENLIICPAAIQSLPDIYKQIKKSKVTDKVVFGVFI